MSERKMTIKGWLHKASGKVSAEGFLAAHRAWLETGEMAEVASPILRRYDQKELLPTPTLELLSRTLLQHHLLAETLKAEAKLLAAGASPTASASKTWEVTCYDSHGNIQTRVNAKGETVDLSESFALQQRASEWADRRLVHDCASDCFATLIHVPSGLEAVIMRNDAMGRVFPKIKTPMVKKTGSRDGKLSFGVKSKPSHSVFSRG